MNESGILLGIAGIFIGVIGFVVSYSMSRERKAFFCIRSIAMQAGSHPDLAIKYQGSKLSNIFSVRFILWNAGGRVISRQDIPSPEAGPRIKFPEESRRLFHKIIITGEDNSGKLTEIEANELAMEFDHLEKGDALLGEVLCTTTDNSPLNANLSGHFKGTSIKQGDADHRSTLENIFYALAAILIFILTISFAYLAFLAFTSSQIVMGITWGLLCLFCFWLTVLDIRTNILSIPNKLPKKFRHFLDFGIMP